MAPVVYALLCKFFFLLSRLSKLQTFAPILWARIIKDIITDGQNVEPGSFNYTRCAAKTISEIALVVRGVPALPQTSGSYFGRFAQAGILLTELTSSRTHCLRALANAANFL